MRSMLRWCAPLLLCAACGGDDSPCDPVAQTGCDDGLACEQVQDGTPACFAPVVIRGRVFDLADASAVAGARVVALDVNRAAVSTVVTTGDDGSYALRIPSTRDADGNPLPLELTLRVDAAGFQSFPAGLREAIPVNTADAVAGDDGLIVDSSLTAVGLIALGADAGTATLRGRVEVPADGAGVLVVAEQGGAGGHDAIADRDGDYVIFNLPAGDYDVKAYARGHVHAPATASLLDGGDATLDLALTEEVAANVDGSVSIVNGGGSSATSVVVFVESTFDPVLGRGASPPGLRAPDPGLAPDVSGAFTLTGVPPGRYVVLAGFENDGLVRDPDTCIAGTDIVHVEVAAGVDQTLESSFKITGALQILSPGADGAQAITDAAPVLSWVDDSSEDLYRCRVYDALGNLVWDTEVPGTSGENPSVTYNGEPLVSGMYYQLRVTSVRLGGGGGDACEIAASEDLRGVFYVP